jgi:hypothetical protein
MGWKRPPRLSRESDSPELAGLPSRFWINVEPGKSDDECWGWTGPVSTQGYGRMSVNGSLLGAHRIAYELEVGEVTTGLTLDHLCRNRLCVNPAHLEPVTRGENVLRGEGWTAVNARKTHCPRGHPLSGDNLHVRPNRGTRQCLSCRREASRRRYRKRKETQIGVE